MDASRAASHGSEKCAARDAWRADQAGGTEIFTGACLRPLYSPRLCLRLHSRRLAWECFAQAVDPLSCRRRARRFALAAPFRAGGRPRRSLIVPRDLRALMISSRWISALAHSRRIYIACERAPPREEHLRRQIGPAREFASRRSLCFRQYL